MKQTDAKVAFRAITYPDPEAVYIPNKRRTKPSKGNHVWRKNLNSTTLEGRAEEGVWGGSKQPWCLFQYFMQKPSANCISGIWSPQVGRNLFCP